MNNQEIVAKLWNLCNVLRDDGITYQQYVTELTYILFLKMAKETGAETGIPEQYRWDTLADKDGVELKDHYQNLLRALGTSTGRIGQIYKDAVSAITKPANLRTIVLAIDQLDWYSAREEGLGNLYEAAKKDLATSTKASSKRTPPRKNPAPASTSPRASSSTS